MRMLQDESELYARRLFSAFLECAAYVFVIIIFKRDRHMAFQGIPSAGLVGEQRGRSSEGGEERKGNEGLRSRKAVRMSIIETDFPRCEVILIRNPKLFKLST